MVVFPCLFIPHPETFVQLFVLFPGDARITVASSLVALGFQPATTAFKPAFALEPR
jgi:hypothetical protein